MHHGDPDQGESWNVLAEVRRVAAGGDPLGDPREVEVLDGLPDEVVVAPHVEGDRGLNPRVPDVLKLFVGRVSK